MTHWSANSWSTDQRPIIAAQLSSYISAHGVFLATDGWQFERFERSGEMASIPFLRMTKGDVVIESSLRSFDWVEFRDEL